MRGVLKSLGFIARTILYAWFPALLRMLRALCRRLGDKRSERDKRAARSHCVPIDDPAFLRPDPLIYSQARLMQLGLAVTWDNPDIQLFREGVPVSSHELLADTEYEVRARCWNDSFDAPAVDCSVHFSYLDFGIGTVSKPIGSTTVDIGVKGSTTQPAFASIKWRTPRQPGHYCLQALLDPLDDRDTGNNLGQENTDVKVAQSPVPFDFTLRNDGRKERRFHFEVTAYELRRQPCRGTDAKNRLAAHRREDHRIPAGWAVTITPPTASLSPGQSIQVDVVITPPDGFVGEQAFNIDAFDQAGAAAGGVTLKVVGKG